MTSIRRQLLLGQIGALILTGLLFSLITYTLAWDAFNRIRDYGLEQIAYSVLRHGVDTASDTNAAADEDKGQFLSQIWDTDGTLAYSSQEDISLPPQAAGLHVVVLGKDEWRVYTLRQAGVTIQVANTTASRNRMFARIIPWLVLPLTLLVGLLGSVIWVAVGRALGPLERVRKEIVQRDAPSLHALETRGLPEEVEPLVSGLNDLLARLDAALTAQRRFVTDAAHELRSPLTAVKLQAQIARQAQDPVERDAALRQLLDGVDRAAHMVEQLLRMARLAPEAQRVVFADVRLDELAKRVVGEFSAQAEAREIDLGVGECQPVSLPGHADSLRVMIGNLVDNALRYIPRGGRVDVEVHQTVDQAVLVVRDDGPGIAPEERDRVFDRFYRLSGSAVPGSGLGLAIVKGVVDLHGGRIWLDATEASGRGLKVTVGLPLHTP